MQSLSYIVLYFVSIILTVGILFSLHELTPLKSCLCRWYKFVLAFSQIFYWLYCPALTRIKYSNNLLVVKAKTVKFKSIRFLLASKVTESSNASPFPLFLWILNLYKYVHEPSLKQLMKFKTTLPVFSVKQPWLQKCQKWGAVH